MVIANARCVLSFGCVSGCFLQRAERELKIDSDPKAYRPRLKRMQ